MRFGSKTLEGPGVVCELIVLAVPPWGYMGVKVVKRLSLDTLAGCTEHSHVGGLVKASQGKSSA